MICGSSLIRALEFALLASPVVSLHIPSFRRQSTANYTTTLIANVAVPGSLENLAVRHTGDLIVTSTSSSSLFQVSPDGSTSPILIGQIPNASSLNGIAELDQDIFYVTSKVKNGTVTVAGTHAVWKVDMTAFDANGDGSGAALSLVANFPNASLLNGLCRLSSEDNSTLLISDSVAGSVIKLNVETGAFETVISDAAMKVSKIGNPIAINGIHVFGSDLFFMNTNQGTFSKMPIDITTGNSTGAAEVIVNTPAGDDFLLSSDGETAWIAMNGQFTVLEVDIVGKLAAVVANSTLLQADTAVSFGRLDDDRNSLYVTAGATVDGATVGQVVRLDLV